jgi:replicative DNA helicase
VGGVSFITLIGNITPTAAYVEHHVRMVAEASLRRQCLESGKGIAAMSRDDTVDAQSLIANAENEIRRLSSARRATGFVPIHDIMADTVERIGSRLEKGETVTGLSTGFPDLDRLISGLQNSDFVILAARPSVGKTALALNIAANIALRGAKEGEPPKRIAFFSMEMSKSQLVHRMVCTEAEVDRDELVPEPEAGGENITEVMNRVWEAYDKIAGANIYINDTPSLTIQQVRSSIRQLQAESGVDLIIIDYLQLMQAPADRAFARNRQHEVSQISRELKALARELNVPVLALSQLSRCVELRPNKRPMLSDLRESGSLEQDADIVMFLYRENYYNSEEPSHITELIVAKHRNGPTGKINLFFKSECTKFVGLSACQYPRHEVTV